MSRRAVPRRTRRLNETRSAPAAASWVDSAPVVRRRERAHRRVAATVRIDAAAVVRAGRRSRAGAEQANTVRVDHAAVLGPDVGEPGPQAGERGCDLETDWTGAMDRRRRQGS